MLPTATSTPHNDKFITRMPADLRAHVDAAYPSEYERNRHNYPGAKRVKEKTTQKGTNISQQSDFILVSAPVSFPNGAVLDVHVAKDGDAEPDSRVGPAYWAVVEAEARSARWTQLWRMGLVWLVPCLGLYALGWSVAWIRRGFRF